MQRHHLIAIGLVLATLVAFEPLRQNGFVNFDDGVYITGNPHVQSGLSPGEFAWAFNLGHASNWHPLTWFSHMLDVSLWGRDARGHHLTSLALHALSVALLFLLVRRMTKATGKSAFVAAAFALHPLHVEPVAWVSERKDVLSALLGFLSLWAWVGWTEKGGIGRYAAALGLFALGLMAKPMLVSLPFVLLLLDAWPLKRIARAGGGSSGMASGRSAGALLREKIPFFVLAGLSCAMTVVAQRRGGAVAGVVALPLSFRLGNAACAYVAYIAKALWPAKLSVFYPYPRVLSAVKVAACSLFLLGSTALSLLHARARPWLAVGWLWWVGMLVPVIGIVQVGQQSMADRYTYMPLVGLAIAFAWGLDELVSRWSSGKTASAVLAVAVVGAWAVVTRTQTALWKDDLSLFGHAVAVTEGNSIAHYRLGYALSEQHRFDEALAEYREALAANPRYADAHNDIGRVLERQGQHELAIESYRKAVEIDPGLAVAHLNLAHALDASGRFPEAALHFEQALRIAPDVPEAHNDYAVALSQQGRFDDALAHFSQALRLKPGYGDAYLFQGLALANMGRVSEAIESLREGIRLRPDRTDAKGLLEQMLRDQRATAPSPAPR
jgi:Tfp pilus assembly protein PilF